MELEREVERKLVHIVKDMGGVAYKWVSPGNDGVPDRIVTLPGGRVVFVELKTDRGQLSPQQIRQCQRLAAMGHDVRVVWGMSGVAAFLEIYDETPHRLKTLMRNYDLTYKDVGEAEVKMRCFLGGDAK